MNFLSGRGAEEPTVYGWNTKVSAPFNFFIFSLHILFHFDDLGERKSTAKLLSKSFPQGKLLSIQPTLYADGILSVASTRLVIAFNFVIGSSSNLAV